jgi:hypothetical protein
MAQRNVLEVAAGDQTENRSRHGTVYLGETSTLETGAGMEPVSAKLPPRRHGLARLVWTFRQDWRKHEGRPPLEANPLKYLFAHLGDYDSRRFCSKQSESVPGDRQPGTAVFSETGNNPVTDHRWKTCPMLFVQGRDEKNDYR